MIIAWFRLNLAKKILVEGNVKERKNEIPVYFPEEGFYWQQFGLLAEQFHQQQGSRTFEALYGKFRLTIIALMALVKSLDNDELYDNHGSRIH